MSVTNNNQNITKMEKNEMCKVKYNIFDQSYETAYGIKIPAFIESEHDHENISMRQEFYDQVFYDDHIGPALSLSDLDTEDTEDIEEFSIAHKAAANQIPTKRVFNMKNSAACLDFYDNDEELRIACRTINQLFPSQKPNNSLKRSTAVEFQDEIDASEIKFDLDKYRNKCNEIDNCDKEFWEEKIAYYEFNGYEFNECCEEYVNEFWDNTDIEIKEKYAASIEKCIKRER